MIGTILSMHYVGKKNWTMSVVFWVVYLISMAIVSAILTAVAPTWKIVSIVVSAAVFILLAHKWYKFDYMNSIKLFAIAFVIDIIIVYVIFAAIVGFYGILLPGWFPYL